MNHGRIKSEDSSLVVCRFPASETQLSTPRRNHELGGLWTPDSGRTRSFLYGAKASPLVL